jgi:hypothetical protein
MNQESITRRDGFLKELQLLINKYNVEIEVVDRYNGGDIQLNFQYLVIFRNHNHKA